MTRPAERPAERRITDAMTRLAACRLDAFKQSRGTVVRPG